MTMLGGRIFYCDQVSVCLCVFCPLLYLQNEGPNFTKFSVRVVGVSDDSAICL